MQHERRAGELLELTIITEGERQRREARPRRGEVALDLRGRERAELDRCVELEPLGQRRVVRLAARDRHRHEASLGAERVDDAHAVGAARDVDLVEAVEQEREAIALDPRAAHTLGHAVRVAELPDEPRGERLLRIAPRREAEDDGERRRGLLDGALDEHGRELEQRDRLAGARLAEDEQRAAAAIEVLRDADVRVDRLLVLVEPRRAEAEAAVDGGAPLVLGELDELRALRRVAEHAVDPELAHALEEDELGLAIGRARGGGGAATRTLGRGGVTRVERPREVVRARETRRGVLGEAAQDRRGDVLGQLGVRRARARRVVARDGDEQVHLGRAAERWPPGRHLVEHDAEREEIGALIELLAARLLGRHVRRRAHARAVLRELHLRLRLTAHGRGGVLELREAEIDDLRRALGRDEDVLGLEIAVHDALVVRLRERERDAARDGEEALERQRLADEVAAQRLALDELHREVRAPVRLADLVDRDEVRVRHGGRRARLAQEAGAPSGIARDLFAQHLQRDRAAEALVVGEVDDAHAAAPELGDDREVVEPRADEGLRRGGRRAHGRARRSAHGEATRLRRARPPGGPSFTDRETAGRGSRRRRRAPQARRASARATRTRRGGPARDPRAARAR